MEYNLLLQNLLKILNEKYPNGSTSRIIEETLELDKLAVYRRIKGIVQFSALEITKLCTSLDLSLDSIFKVNPRKKYQLTLHHNKLSEEADKEYNDEILRETLEILKISTNSEHSQIIMGATTIIPEILSLPYETLSRVQRCNWKYCNNLEHSQIKMANIIFPQQQKSIFQQYINLMKKFTTTIYIFYEDLFRLFFSNILFLYEIKMITREEMNEIKNEMEVFFTDLEELAVKGYWYDPTYEVRIFISSFMVNNDYVFIDSTNMKLILFNAFNMNFITSVDQPTLEQVKVWMKIVTKSSILISGSGMKSRIDFFDKQYQYLKMLNV